MAAHYRKVRAGEPLNIPAQTWNDLLQVAQEHFDNRSLTGSGGLNFDLGEGSTVIRVKNETGQILKRFSIIGLDEPIVLPPEDLNVFKTSVMFRGVIPVLEEHRDRFAILTQPLAVNEVGKAWTSGVCQCQIDVTDQVHEKAEVKNNSVVSLKSDSEGSVKILWKESGTGIKWAIVRFGSVAGAASIGNFIITSTAFPDTVVCRTWNGVAQGQTDIHVAKRWDLRKTIFATLNTIYATNYGLTFQDDPTSPTFERTQSRRVFLADQASFEYQVCVPRYLVGMRIDAISVPKGSQEGDPLVRDSSWLEVSGRYWAKRRFT